MMLIKKANGTAMAPDAQRNAQGQFDREKPMKKQIPDNAPKRHPAATPQNPNTPQD